jgi:starvation-inducible DNA-binding protein
MGKDYANPFYIKPQVKIQPKMELDCTPHQQVLNILYITLADEAVLGMKTRVAISNTHEPTSYRIRTQFDLQYKQLLNISHEISKRILDIDGLPIGSLMDFLKNARLDELSVDVPDSLTILADHEKTIQYLRGDAKKCMETYDDKATQEFLLGILSQHEKIVEILRSGFENDTTSR